jgi:hypothetical protein
MASFSPSHGKRSRRIRLKLSTSARKLQQHPGHFQPGRSGELHQAPGHRTSLIATAVVRRIPRSSSTSCPKKSPCLWVASTSPSNSSGRCSRTLPLYRMNRSVQDRPLVDFRHLVMFHTQVIATMVAHSSSIPEMGRCCQNGQDSFTSGHELSISYPESERCIKKKPAGVEHLPVCSIVYWRYFLRLLQPYLQLCGTPFPSCRSHLPAPCHRG